MSATTGRVLAVVGLGLAVLTAVAAGAAAWVGSLAPVLAAVAFVRTIPFMSTLLPFLLGAAMLTSHRAYPTPSRLSPGGCGA